MSFNDSLLWMILLPSFLLFVMLSIRIFSGRQLQPLKEADMNGDLMGMAKFRWLTLRNMIHGLLVFSASTLFIWNGFFPFPFSWLAGILLAIISVPLIFKLLRTIVRKYAPWHFSPESALGLCGQATETIPAGGQSCGKVMLQAGLARQKVYAFTRSENEIPAGSKVYVSEALADGKIWVSLSHDKSGN